MVENGGVVGVVGWECISGAVAELQRLQPPDVPVMQGNGRQDVGEVSFGVANVSYEGNYSSYEDIYIPNTYTMCHMRTIICHHSHTRDLY